MEQPTVLLIGLGHVGGPLLDLLACDPAIGSIVACSRRPETGEARCNLSRLAAASRGIDSHIDYSAVDLIKPGSLTDVIERTSPDLIISTASLQTWWLSELLPGPARQRLHRARFGAWLPMHLALNICLMRTLKEIEYSKPVLTAPFPDVVNAILAKIDLAPTAGVGNVDEIATKVQWLVARKLAVSIESIQVSLVGHHALEPAAFGGREGKDHPPFHLRVFHQGEDITESSAAEELLFEPLPLPAGPAWSVLTAGSALRLVKALLDDDDTRLHAPAPKGLPGGYPVVVGKSRIEVAEIPGIGLDEAIEINEQSHPFDGILRIEADGTAILIPETADILRSELGYDCDRLDPADALERGRELRSRFREYGVRHGVDFSTYL